jgi:outer membrane protein OmpA-like peptidoglycan-associated protein
MGAKRILTPDRLLLGAFLALVLAAGCASKPNVFVLLSDPDGQTGSITVSNPAGSQVLDQPGQATKVKGDDKAPGKPYQMKEEELAELFGAALAAQPEAPVRFILYFETDSTDLTAESLALIPEIVGIIEERGSTDTSVIGHTDTAGAPEYNLRLSKRRAEWVGQMLISRGVDPAILDITSHGEENLLIETGDEVVEPRNRRVEVTVR